MLKVILLFYSAYKCNSRHAVVGAKDAVGAREEHMKLPREGAVKVNSCFTAIHDVK